MSILSMAEFRANLARYCDQVTGAHKPLRVTRGKKPGVVVMSEEDYGAMQETFYLLKSPRNAARLLESIDAVEKGEVVERKLEA